LVPCGLIFLLYSHSVGTLRHVPVLRASCHQISSLGLAFERQRMKLHLLFYFLTIMAALVFFHLLFLALDHFLMALSPPPPPPPSTSRCKSSTTIIRACCAMGETVTSPPGRAAGHQVAIDNPRAFNEATGRRIVDPSTHFFGHVLVCLLDLTFLVLSYFL